MPVPILLNTESRTGDRNIGNGKEDLPKKF